MTGQLNWLGVEGVADRKSLKFPLDFDWMSGYHGQIVPDFINYLFPFQMHVVVSQMSVKNLLRFCDTNIQTNLLPFV